MSGATQTVTATAIRLCTGTCGRMTRPSDVRFEMAPDTVPRWKGGKCSACYRRELSGSNHPLIIDPATGRPSQIRLCAGGCGRDTRPSGVRAEDAPETVARCRNNMCKSCVARIEGLQNPSRKNNKQPATEEDIERYRHSLESWLEGWRARHERAIRREHTTASSGIQAGQRQQVVLQHQSR